jgi:hypothetical protein
LKKYFIGGAAVLVVMAATFCGVRIAASADPSGFWKSFAPSLLANIIGVSIAAIVGIPAGIMINQFMARITTHRHYRHQVSEVRELLRQVKIELDMHGTPLFRITQGFTSFQASIAAQPTQLTVSRVIDVTAMMLRDSSGQMFIKSSPSVLSIDESVILFRVTSYYSRVTELNNLLTWRGQSPQPPALWDRRIEELGNAIGFDRLQLDYEVQQVVARLTGEGRSKNE